MSSFFSVSVLDFVGFHTGLIAYFLICHDEVTLIQIFSFAFQCLVVIFIVRLSWSYSQIPFYSLYAPYLVTFHFILIKFHSKSQPIVFYKHVHKILDTFCSTASPACLWNVSLIYMLIMQISINHQQFWNIPATFLLLISNLITFSL